MKSDDGFVEDPLTILRSALAESEINTERVRVVGERLRDLLSMSRSVTAQLELSTVLREVVIAATRLVGVPYGAIGVIGSDGSFTEFIHVGVSADDVQKIGHIPQGRGLLGAVVRDAHTIRLPDLAEDPRFAGFPTHHPQMVAFLGVPVRTRTEVYGNLYLTSPEVGNFTAEDERIIEALAATAGVAIENARAYERSRRERRLSAALSRVATALLDPHQSDALKVVASECASVIDSATVAVVVPDTDPRLLRVRVASGPLSAALRDATFDRADSLALRAMQLGEVVADDGPVRDYAGGVLQLGPTAAVTLIARGETIGALCVSKKVNSHPFSGEEVDIVGEFAAQAGLAVSLSWAREDQEQLRLIEDRARIARDLHDHVIQRLFATGLALEHAAETSIDQSASLRQHVASIDAAVSDIRTAISALRTPSKLADRPVRVEVFELVEELTSALGLRPSVMFAGPVDTLILGGLREDVMAVVREGLTNVARHAKATRCTLSISADDTSTVITVEDDGIGAGDAPGRGSGTTNLHARALARGGTSDLMPNRLGGLTLRWQSPVRRDWAAPS